MNINLIQQIFEGSETNIPKSFFTKALKQRIKDLQDESNFASFKKDTLNGKVLWLMDGIANPSARSVIGDVNFPDSVSCYALVVDGTISLRVRFSNHFNQSVRRNLGKKQAKKPASEIITFVFGQQDDVKVMTPIKGVPFTKVTIDVKHLSIQNDVTQFLYSIIDYLNNGTYKLPSFSSSIVPVSHYKKEGKTHYTSLLDYITEQKYINTTYNMKSLKSYINENGSRELYQDKAPKKSFESFKKVLNKLTRKDIISALYFSNCVEDQWVEEGVEHQLGIVYKDCIELLEKRIEELIK